MKKSTKANSKIISEKKWAKTEKKFQEIKRRDDIKQRYGVFTQKMFEQLLEELRSRIKDDLKGELHKLDGKLDWLIGAYKKIDEEEILLSNKYTNLDERIEKLEHNRPLAVQ